jgi:hypothetical protein
VAQVVSGKPGIKAGESADMRVWRPQLEQERRESIFWGVEDGYK